MTHDPLVSEQVQRTVAIRDGRTSQRDVRRTELARRRRSPRHQRRVRGPRPGRSAAAPEGAHRGARAVATGSACGSRTTTSGSGPTRPRPGGPTGRTDDASHPPRRRRTPRRRAASSRPIDARSRLPGRRLRRPCRADVDLPSRPASWSRSVAARGRQDDAAQPPRRSRPPDVRPASSIDGLEISAMSEDELVDLRRRTLAFIFQAFGLVRSCPRPRTSRSRCGSSTPSPRARRPRRDAARPRRARRAGEHRPHELSGGEQQRVAIARALANAPSSCSPTSRPASSTPRPATRSCCCSGRSCGTKGSPRCRDPRPADLDVADRVFELRDGRFVAPPGGPA